MILVQIYKRFSLLLIMCAFQIRAIGENNGEDNISYKTEIQDNKQRHRCLKNRNGYKVCSKWTVQKFPRFSMKNSQNFQSRLYFVRIWAVMRTGDLGENS